MEAGECILHEFRLPGKVALVTGGRGVHLFVNYYATRHKGYSGIHISKRSPTHRASADVKVAVMAFRGHTSSKGA